MNGGVVRNVPEPEIHEGGLLDTQLLKSLSEKEEQKYDQIVREAKSRVEAECKDLLESLREICGRAIKEQNNNPRLTETFAKKVFTEKLQGILLSSAMLDLDRKTSVLVSEILDNPAKYDGMSCCDPVEGKEYGTNKAKIYANINTDGRVRIHSMAHGLDKTFTLKYDEPTILQRIDEWDSEEAAVEWQGWLVHLSGDLSTLQLSNVKDAVRRKLGMDNRKRDFNVMWKEFKKEMNSRRNAQQAAGQGDKENERTLDFQVKNYALIVSGQEVVDLRMISHGWEAIYTFDEFTKDKFCKVEVDGADGPVSLTHAWLSDPRTQKLRGKKFAPDKPNEHIIEQENGNKMLNTYAPIIWIPTFEEPIVTLEHIRYMLPREDERVYFMDWLKYQVQNPGRRLPMVLMVADGVFGIGRGSLNNLIQTMFKPYSGEIDFMTFCGVSGSSVFNDWMTEKLFVVVPEIKEFNSANASRIKYEAYEHIKGIVDTAPQRGKEINPKYGKKHNADIFFNVLANSNHSDAMVIPEGDRRIAVLENPNLKNNEVGYYEQLYNVMVLNPELEAKRLWHYLLNEKISETFNPGVPIYTPAKQVMEECSLSPADQLFEDAKLSLPGDIVTRKQFETKLRELTLGGGKAGRFFEGRISFALNHFKKLPTLDPNDRRKQFKILGEAPERPRILRNTEKWQKMVPNNMGMIRNECEKNNSLNY